MTGDYCFDDIKKGAELLFSCRKNYVKVCNTKLIDNMLMYDKTSCKSTFVFQTKNDYINYNHGKIGSFEESYMLADIEDLDVYKKISKKEKWTWVKK